MLTMARVLTLFCPAMERVVRSVGYGFLPWQQPGHTVCQRAPCRLCGVQDLRRAEQQVGDPDSRAQYTESCLLVVGAAHVAASMIAR